MKLGELLAKAGLAGGGEESVTGFAIDHRKVAPGTVFGAFAGATVNGEDFIQPAIAAGAIAVVARPEARVEGVLHIADATPAGPLRALLRAFFSGACHPCCGDWHQRQDLLRRDDPPDLADGGRARGEHRYAGCDHA